MHKKNVPGRYAELQARIKSRREQTVNLEQLLNVNEIKTSIAKFVIFNRIQTLLVSYTIDTIDSQALETLIKSQYADHRQSLIARISDFPICKAANWQPDVISKAIKH